MSATVLDQYRPLPRRSVADRVRWEIADGIAMTWRNLLTLARVPQLLVFATIQPILFVIMLRYVFSGSISIPGCPLRRLPDAGDLPADRRVRRNQHRHRPRGGYGQGAGRAVPSLPTARSAVLAGHTTSDLICNVFVIVLMVAVGVLVGLRTHAGVVPFLGGLLVLLMFGFALS